MEVFRAPQEKGGGEWRIAKGIRYDSDETTAFPQEKPKRTGRIETTPLPRMPNVPQPQQTMDTD